MAHRCARLWSLRFRSYAAAVRCRVFGIAEVIRLYRPFVMAVLGPDPTINLAIRAPPVLRREPGRTQP